MESDDRRKRWAIEGSGTGNPLHVPDLPERDSSPMKDQVERFECYHFIPKSEGNKGFVLDMAANGKASVMYGAINIIEMPTEAAIIIETFTKIITIDGQRLAPIFDNLHLGRVNKIIALSGNKAKGIEQHSDEPLVTAIAVRSKGEDEDDEDEA